MASAKPDILIHGPVMPMIIEQLDQSFTVHKLWEAKDRDKFLAELAPSLRVIVAGGGHGQLDGAFMSRVPKLEMISSFGVGYDHIDAKWAGEHGITISNTPDVLTEEVADTTIGLLIATVRELPAAERHLRAGKWSKGDYPLTGSLRSRKAGILGLGRIGKAIARRLEAFGVSVAYWGRRKQGDVSYPFYSDLVAMARDVDILIVIVPGGPDTKNIVNAQVLEALGPTGVVINVARGSVIDEPALIKALQNKTIASAGLDVFINEPEVPKELLAMDHVVLLPHVGSASHDARNAMAQRVVDNVLGWAQGKGPLSPVAETPWPPKRPK
jgi:lactate dehydrogenase-like 2-hydroxyacid dehydrogenase